MTLAPNFLPASSKDVNVLVEFQKRLIKVLPFMFFKIVLGICFLFKKLLATFKIPSISVTDKSFIESKCLVFILRHTMT